MKKYLVLSLLLVLSLFMVTGCGNKDESSGGTGGESKKLNCSINQSENGTSVDVSYVVHYSEGNVDKIEIKEIVKSDNEETLDYFEEYLESNYSLINSTYGGYSYDITRADDTIYTDVVADYNKLDVETYIKDYPILAAYANKDKTKISVEGIKTLYSSIGITCDK